MLAICRLTVQGTWVFKGLRHRLFLMSHPHVRKKKVQKTIAARRIQQLFHLAEKAAFQRKLALADRYVELARTLAMRYLLSLPLGLKRRFCTHCYRYLLPGVTCRVRIHRGKIVTYCYSCQRYMRMPLMNRHDQRMTR